MPTCFAASTRGFSPKRPRRTRPTKSARTSLSRRRRRAAISRYSHSSIHQNAVSDETHVRVRAIVGKAVGVVTTNSLAVADVRRAFADAAALARASRADLAWPGVAEPAPIPSSAAFHEETAHTDALAQARAIGAICAAVPQGMRAPGTSPIAI